MTLLEQHRDLALMILVGRALPEGLPWTPDEDQGFVSRERLLWVQLTEEEQAQEQEALGALWGKRGAPRTVPVNPQWGAWTEGLTEVSIPDSAFGLPDNAFRPLVKGIQILAEEHPELIVLLEWLWKRGFHPVAFDGDTLTLLIPPHRIVQESERLVGILIRDWPKIPVVSRPAEASLTVKGSYDPVSGQAIIYLSGVTPFQSTHLLPKDAT